MERIDAWSFPDSTALKTGNILIINVSHLGEIDSLSKLEKIAKNNSMVGYTKGEFPKHINITFSEAKGIIEKNNLTMWERIKKYFLNE